MATLRELLNGHNMNTLKALLAYVPGASPVGRKDVLVDAIVHGMSGAGLPRMWEQLDACQRLAVGEAAHDARGVFHRWRFEAKYGQEPAFHYPAPGQFASEGKMTVLCLFLYWVDGVWMLPSDLRAQLRQFVAVPAPNALGTVEAPPALDVDDEPLTLRTTERDALQDLAVMLRMVDQGQIAVSDKTRLPGAAALRLVGDKLAGGDFYAIVPPKDKWEQVIGPIKALAWPLLLQGAGLAQLNGSKLALSPAGVKAMSAAPADTLRAIWREWRNTSLLDEFSRIDEIKGQKGKGRVMSAPAPRRAVIGALLQRCPPGKWIAIDELSRFMQAEGCWFDVCHDYSRLYISDPNYGHLGYSGTAGWEMLQLRYLLCLLFEYCATLGMIDVAYRTPEGARDDYCGHWGADDLVFLSRYDGLVYFRLTALGAYCLGVSNSYTPAAPASTCRLQVGGNLQVSVAEGTLSADEALLLDDWALQESELVWRLNREKAVAAIERGHDSAQLAAFLQARDSQPLPVQVDSFLRTCQKQGRALKVLAASLLIECIDAQTADLIAGHKETAGLCLRAGERHLVVQQEHEARFRKAARQVGYGMPA
ncbi:MAG: hypothetical protein V4724_39070 [Pseudomonadota bacterium]